jgi:hypothetical protein
MTPALNSGERAGGGITESMSAWSRAVDAASWSDLP